MHSRLRQGLGAFAAALLCASTALAQYPTRPIRLIVAQAPGGNADIVARTLAAKLGERLGQQVVADNRPGASGIIAAELTVRAPADGYTILLVPSSFGVNPSIRKLPYDSLRDLAPVTLAGTAPNILVVNPSVPIRSVADLAALARAKPGQLRFASSGNAGSVHLAGELFKTMANVDMMHIPYKGAAPALVEVVAGHVEMSFASMPTGLPLARSGKLRGVAVTSLARSIAIPELPTFAESGFPGFETAAWQGILAPARTPAAIIARLNVEIAAAVKSPDVRERLLADGAEPVGNSPEAFARYLRDEIEKWAKVVRATGLRID